MAGEDLDLADAELQLITCGDQSTTSNLSAQAVTYYPDSIAHSPNLSTHNDVYCVMV